MSSVTLDYINDTNLNNSNYLQDYIRKITTKDLLSIVENLQSAIEEDYITGISTPFTFVPCGDLSGADGCSEINCKKSRALRFANFSALYADHVYLQLPFLTSQNIIIDSDTIDSDDELYYKYRDSILSDIEIINQYFELIKSGIVHLIPIKNAYCKNCFQKALLGLKNPISLNSMNEKYSKQVKIVITDFDEFYNEVGVELQNFDEFYSCGSIFMTLNRTKLNGIPKCKLKKGMEITIPNLKKEIIANFIENEFLDSCYSASYCNELNAKFITNKISDMMFLELTKQNKKNNIYQSENTFPQYDLPLITGISSEDVLKLREVELESFNKYRIALNRAVSEQIKATSTCELNQIYEDILYPSFNELDLKLRQMRSGAFKKTFSKMVILGTTIMAGNFINIVPENIEDFLHDSTIPLCSALYPNLVRKKPQQEIQMLDNDFYFLWKLKLDNKIIV